jgi:hypothetical protein
MLFKSAVLAGIKEGRVTLAFRRWTQARIKAGSEIRTALGVVGITGVEAVALTAVTEADARKAGYETRDLLVAELRKSKIGTVYRIGLRYTGSDPRATLREKPLTKEDVADIALRLGRLDKASKDGAWTRDVLSLIAGHPAIRAGDLAQQLGWETQAFKIRVRKLKELGLTESLEIGYRLSPRGAAFLKAAPRRPM